MFQKGNAYYAEWYDAGKRYRRSFDNPQQANKFQSERRAEVYAKKSQPSLSIPPQPRGPQSLHAASTVVSIKSGRCHQDGIVPHFAAVQAKQRPLLQGGVALDIQGYRSR
jgi:hypothetical protein